MAITIEFAQHLQRLMLTYKPHLFYNGNMWCVRFGCRNCGTYYTLSHDLRKAMSLLTPTKEHRHAPTS
jgi:hypothetical protein